MASKHTILVVDDEPTVRSLIADLLSEEGHVCISAGNGIDAVRLIESDVIRIDLLITDMMMPGNIGGLAVAARMVALQEETRILLISGYTDPAIAEEAARQGFRIVPKPFRRKDLIDAVAEELAKLPDQPPAFAAPEAATDSAEIVPLEKARERG
ncbi:MAG: response regulator [Alphaproteobacteria bacterium]|nr:response regulator [Alphaproteobacteria bacterium]